MAGSRKRPHVRSCQSPNFLWLGFLEGEGFVGRFFLAVSKPASVLSEALINSERPSACALQGRS